MRRLILALTMLLAGVLSASAQVTISTSGTASAGADTQVIFNDGGLLAGNAALVFAKAAGTLTIGGTTPSVVFTNTNQHIDRSTTAGLSYYANYAGATNGHRFYGYGGAANQLKFELDNTVFGARVYFNFTDVSNYERFAITPSAGLVTLAAEEAGTGANDISIALNSLGTGSIQINKLALAAVSTDGLVLQNTTAATDGATVQMSPRLVWTGTAWNTTATAASNTVSFFTEVLPATAATPTGMWKLGYSLNGAAATYPISISSLGAVFPLGSITVPGAYAFKWSGRSELYSSADGVLDYKNSANTGFTRQNYGPATTSFTGLATRTANGLELQSGAGTYVWNDAASAVDATVPSHYLFGFGTQPTLSATNGATSHPVTYSDAATMYIANAPTTTADGAGYTAITRPWALWIDAGNLRVDGTYYSGTTPGIDKTCGGPVVSATFTKGILTDMTCTSEPQPTTAELLQMILDLRVEIAALKARQ
jgi:hypothetical protein